MDILEELKSARECGEITEEQFQAAKGISFTIAKEDIVLFIQGLPYDLNSVKSVSYDSFNSKYDGQYRVLMKDGSVRYYGWYDADYFSTLYPIQFKVFYYHEKLDKWILACRQPCEHMAQAECDKLKKIWGQPTKYERE